MPKHFADITDLIRSLQTYFRIGSMTVIPACFTLRKDNDMTLYNLTFTDKELGEQFNIGFFSTRGRAEEIARYYLRNMRGFCEYDCGYTISEKLVVGSGLPDAVYIVYGWNGYEKDIIESDCFTTEALARRKLAEMKSQQYDREEWCVDRYGIDECKWQDGFVRV